MSVSVSKCPSLLRLCQVARLRLALFGPTRGLLLRLYQVAFPPMGPIVG